MTLARTLRALLRAIGHGAGHAPMLAQAGGKESPAGASDGAQFSSIALVIHGVRRACVWQRKAPPEAGLVLCQWVLNEVKGVLRLKRSVAHRLARRYYPKVASASRRAVLVR